MRYICFILFCSLYLTYSCSNNDVISEDYMIANQEEKLSKLASTRIIFGHQSVGQNIIDGLMNLNKDNEINIVSKDKINNLPESFFLHFKIGENENPQSKCDDFGTIIDSNHEKIDYAFMKFCYIDINRNSDVEELFAYYKTTMDSLIKKYPDVTFLHLTSPLRFNAKGFGVWIRELLGRPNNSKLDNVKRNNYNKFLTSYYPEENIFNLAKAQSTYLNGNREYFEMNNEQYFSLIEEYTSDGGHLNELGSKWIAQNFIQYMADILEEK